MLTAHCRIDMTPRLYYTYNTYLGKGARVCCADYSSQGHKTHANSLYKATIVCISFIIIWWNSNFVLLAFWQGNMLLWQSLFTFGNYSVQVCTPQAYTIVTVTTLATTFPFFFFVLDWFFIKSQNNLKLFRFFDEKACTTSTCCIFVFVTT